MIPLCSIYSVYIIVDVDCYFSPPFFIFLRELWKSCLPRFVCICFFFHHLSLVRLNPWVEHHTRIDEPVLESIQT